VAPASPGAGGSSYFPRIDGRRPIMSGWAIGSPTCCWAAPQRWSASTRRWRVRPVASRPRCGRRTSGGRGRPRGRLDGCSTGGTIRGAWPGGGRAGARRRRVGWGAAACRRGGHRQVPAGCGGPHLGPPARVRGPRGRRLPAAGRPGLCSGAGGARAVPGRAGARPLGRAGQRPARSWPVVRWAAPAATGAAGGCRPGADPPVRGGGPAGGAGRGPAAGGAADRRPALGRRRLAGTAALPRQGPGGSARAAARHLPSGRGAHPPAAAGAGALAGAARAGRGAPPRRPRPGGGRRAGGCSPRRRAAGRAARRPARARRRDAAVRHRAHPRSARHR
jgi:hypothetical protein